LNELKNNSNKKNLNKNNDKFPYSIKEVIFWKKY
jgi:hypothetical protein